VKISVEPMQGFRFNVEEGTSEAVSGVRVEWQATKGGKREHANIIMESSVPQDMLRAAAAFFEEADR
jgi:hypothetical protein